MFFDERRIVIDESLDPEENPSKEGRYRFTLGARGRRALAAASSPVRQGPGAGLVVRRAGRSVRRLPVEPGQRSAIEWQADFYASCLLMPRKLVFAAWDEMFPDRKPRVLQPRTAGQSPLRRDPRGSTAGSAIRLLRD